jgi:hypothetical protein
MGKYRVLATTSVMFFALGVVGAGRAWAQNGVIGFWNACDGRAYVMHGEVESATNPPVMLPRSPLASGNQGEIPLDISTHGPVTVLLSGLFIVQVNDNGGVPVPDAEVSIQLDLAAYPNLPPGINNGFARFSPTGDRIALVSDGILVIADIVRDASTQKITALTNPTVVANLADIGSPSDSNISPGFPPFIGYPDFSPDGTQIVVTIYSDLWLLTLMNDGHTLASSRPLTRTLDDTEFQGAFSPDGKTIAYVAGPNNFIRGTIRNLNIFTINLETLGITQLSSKKDALVDTESPAWSPDGQYLAFMAQGQRAPRNSPCGAVVNYDIYELKADGTGTVTALTNTVGTGVEVRNQWGW